MKLKILAGLVTALIYGGPAMAQQTDETKGQQGQSPDNYGGSSTEKANPSDLIILDQQDVAPAPSTGAQQQQEPGVGGAGNVGVQGNVSQGIQQPQAGIPLQQGGVTLYCTPLQQPSTGGAGLQAPAPSEGVQAPAPAPTEEEFGAKKKKPKGTKPEEMGMAPTGVEQPAYGGAGYEEKEYKEPEHKHLRGVGVLIGGGVEGYTGGLAPNINPGAAWDVRVDARPTSVLGIEGSYVGAENEIDRRFGSNGNGSDIISNGANAALTVGLAATPIQPYVLGGIGVTWYNVRHGFAAGFKDDTVGNVPVGVGLRTQVGAFTADLRGDYNFLFSENFAPADVKNNAGTGRYMGSLNLGGTF
ncbi:MAG: outer membrane protein [Archangium sp.]